MNTWLSAGNFFSIFNMMGTIVATTIEIITVIVVVISIVGATYHALTVLRFSFSFQFYRGGGAIDQSVSLAHFYIIHVQNEDSNENKINTNQIHCYSIYGNMIPKKYKTIIIHRNIKMWLIFSSSEETTEDLIFSKCMRFKLE